MSIQLVTLGSLRCSSDGREVIAPSQRQRLALVVYIALERDVTRDQVMAIFWPDVETDRARRALSQGLYELKGALGDEWLTVRGAHLIATEALEVDAEKFADAVRRGDLEQAFSAPVGEFLSGEYLSDTQPFEEWVDRHRARLARLQRTARRDFVNRCAQNGDLVRALEEARHWVEADPLEDEAQHRLIELLAQVGQRAEALRQHEAYTRLMDRENLKPLEQTVRLVERIRAGQVITVDAATSSSKPSSGPVGSTLVARLEADLSPEFEVVREIAQGKIAHVYLARERALQRLVAVKVLRPELSVEQVHRVRFEREARSVAKLVHPNVVTVHRVGQLSDGSPYLVMEYVTGRNLADTLAAEGPLPEGDASSVLAQVAAALAAAHARGILHRDVRPANIVWTRESGRAVLMDFGIAAVAEEQSDTVTRLTESGEILADPAYMSPECLLGQSVTTATDVFSL
ncbi:MAG: protein kinase domain-containing protein, partial [Longimicrobiales bacterium]